MQLLSHRSTLRPDRFRPSGVLVPAQVQVRFQVKMNGSREGGAVPAAETRGGTVQAGPMGTAHTPRSWTLPRRRCQARVRGDRLAKGPGCPWILQKPRLTSLISPVGYNSDDSLCDPSLELEVSSHRQCGEWSTRVSSGLASQTFHQHGFSSTLRPVRKSNTQNRRKYSDSVEVGMRGTQLLTTPSLPSPGA